MAKVRKREMQVEFPCVGDTGSHPPRLLQMPRVENTGASSLGSNKRKGKTQVGML